MIFCPHAKLIKSVQRVVHLHTRMLQSLSPFVDVCVNDVLLQAARWQNSWFLWS